MTGKHFWVYDVSCPNVGSKTAVNCSATANCVKQYTIDSLDKGKVSINKLKIACREQLDRGAECDPVDKSGNSCSSQRADSHLSYVSIEQKRVGVPANQSDPL